MKPSCPACNAADVRLLFEKTGVPYFACRNCRFRFSRPKNNANFQDGLLDYEPVYLEYLSGNAAEDRNFRALVEWIETHASLRDGKLLDVGCGGGNWVRFLREQGRDAMGIEPSEPLYHRFLASDPWFLNTTADDPRLDAAGPFHVVTAFDVLEHVPDPRGLMRRLASLLSPHGWLFATLPDVGSPPARLLGRHWHHFNHYHFSFFDRATIGSVGKSCGFELVDFSRRGRFRSLGYIARYGFEFLFRCRLPARWKALDRSYICLNTHDTMYVAFRKVFA